MHCVRERVFFDFLSVALFLCFTRSASLICNRSFQLQYTKYIYEIYEFSMPPCNALSNRFCPNVSSIIHKLCWFRYWPSDVYVCLRVYPFVRVYSYGCRFSNFQHTITARLCQISFLFIISTVSVERRHRKSGRDR